MSVGRKTLNQIYVHILGLLHVMQWKLHLAGSMCHGRTAWEESQLNSVQAITTVRPARKHLSYNWQVESVFFIGKKNVSFVEALSAYRKG